MLIQQLNSNFDDQSSDKLKCMLFDLSNSTIQYVLYKKFQVWKYRRFMLNNGFEFKSLYKKIKDFKSKAELDMWCAINNKEYEFVQSLNIIR